MSAVRQHFNPVEVLTCPTTTAAEALGLSRAKVYELITSGALRSVRIDGARRVRAADLEAFVESLDSEAA